MFVLPWQFPSDRLCKSESYALGFNNRIALIALLGTFIATVLVRFFFARERICKNYLEWIDPAPVLFPSWKTAKTEYLLLGIFSCWMIVEVLFFNHLLKFPYWSESAYFLKRIDLAALGFRPYVDFQHLYGPLLLYGPLFIDTMSAGILGIENAYAISLILGYLLGFLGFFFYTRIFSLTEKQRCVLLTFFCLIWIPISMGLNYVPLRFSMMLGVIALFHKISLHLARVKKRTFYCGGIFLFTTLALFFTFSISPEMGCVTTLALLTYGCVVLIQEQGYSWNAVSIFLGATASLLLTALFFPGFLGGILIFFSGGNNFPIYPNAPNIVLLIAVLAVLPLLAVSLLCYLMESRTPLAAALIVGGLGMLPAALGRCDPGHVMLNAILLLTLLFPAAAFAGHKYWISSKVIFSLLIALLYFSYWNHYADLCKFAFSEPGFYAEKKELVAAWEKNWAERKQNSPHGILLNWKKTLPYPQGLATLDSLGKIAIPFTPSPSLERFLKLQENYAPCYNVDLDNLCLPEDTASLASSLLTYDAIFLPENAEQLKDIQASVTINLPENSRDKKLHEKQVQHFLSVLMLYPVHSTLIKEPYDPSADLIRQLLPKCHQIGSLPGWIIVRPRNASSEQSSF